MPRPPKQPKDKAAAVPVPAIPVIAQQVPAGGVVDLQHYVRARDAFHHRLTTLQQVVNNLTTEFLRETNLLLGVNASDPQHIDPLISLDGLAQFAPVQPAPVAPAVEEKKERKKRTHDPNAPKRPLTPYFLYMQTARPIIAKDLGAEAPKGAVQEEGQRRWAQMIASEKAGWNTAYRYNLRLYNARVHSYKNGNPDAKSMDDDEALKYADIHGVQMPSDDSEQAAIAEQLAGTNADAHGEVDDAPPAKPKKAPASRKRKTADADEVEAAKAPATPASPDKKRRRSTKATEEKEEPKKSGRKKAAKA